MALEVTPARSLHFDKSMWNETIMSDFEFSYAIIGGKILEK